MNQEQLMELFLHMSEQHNLTLLDSEMNDIAYIVLGKEEYCKRANDTSREVN